MKTRQHFLRLILSFILTPESDFQANNLGSELDLNFSAQLFCLVPKAKLLKLATCLQVAGFGCPVLLSGLRCDD